MKIRLRRMSCKVCGSHKDLTERGPYVYCGKHAERGDRRIIARVMRERPYDWEIDE